MNSKETLENLEDNGRNYLLPVKIYKQIKQDLEILEILKKNITIEKYYAYEILEINLTSIEEDFKKVKEWLKSE